MGVGGTIAEGIRTVGGERGDEVNFLFYSKMVGMDGWTWCNIHISNEAAWIFLNICPYQISNIKIPNNLLVFSPTPHSPPPFGFVFCAHRDNVGGKTPHAAAHVSNCSVVR